MIKLVYCVRKKKDLELAEFRRYWREEHGPLVASVRDAIGAVRYVQSHTVEPELNAGFEASRGLAKPYEGITEVWWPDADTLRAAMDTEAGREAMARLLDDESTFIDFSESRVFMTEEHEIF